MVAYCTRELLIVHVNYPIYIYGNFLKQNLDLSVSDLLVGECVLAVRGWTLVEGAVESECSFRTTVSGLSICFSEEVREWTEVITV